MKELAVFEAKTRLSELLVAVEQGEQFVITRRGVAVARLVSVSSTGVRKSKASARRAGVEQGFADLRSLRAGVTLDAPLREAIEQGRD
jgi:prevent-host-death family protein